MSLQFLGPPPGELNAAALLRTSEVETMPPHAASSSSVPTSGTVFGLLAVCMSAGTYTKIACLHSSTTPTLTQFRMGVHDPSTGALITDTGDIKASIDATTVGKEVPGTLAAPVTLARGEYVFLSVAAVGTPPNLRAVGIAISSMLDLVVPAGYKRGRIATGYASGNLPTLDTAPAAGTIFYLCLRP